MINQNNNFMFLVEKAMQAEGRSHMRPVIEKELLHYDILFALDQAGLLDKVTFQGGTSLRLCYGAPRFSEDLDFAGGKEFRTHDLMAIKYCIEAYFAKRYTLEVSVKEPSEMKQELEKGGIKVSKWQIRIVTHPERPDLPKQIIKIEVANIPAYTREPRPLQQNYDFLPDGYADTLIMVETLDEILADKLVSLVTCRYVRHRDIWDLQWLKQKGATIQSALIHKKLDDYKIENYATQVDGMIERLPGIISGKEFKDQMGRFIPMDVQEKTLLKEKFNIFLQNEVVGLLRDVKQNIGTL